MKKSIILLLLSAVLLYSNRLFPASANFSVNYQGYIKSNGVPVNGIKGFTFRIKDDVGGAIQWESACTDITVSSGAFSATLGDTNAVGDWNTIDWLGIDACIEVVVGDAGCGGSPVTLSPAELLLSNPYGLYASSSTGLQAVSGKLRVASSTVSVNGTDMYFVPSGVVAIWKGSVASIPAGWVLCDGNSGTPDLRNRFVVTVGPTYSQGTSGGETTHTHASSGHTHNLDVGPFTISAAGGGNYGNCCRDNNDPATYGHTHTIDFQSTGSTSASPTVDPGSSLPLYYALCYIMKI